MLGAIVGDIIGSRFEMENNKTKDFDLFTALCRPTDDSIMTLAVAKALTECKPDFSDIDKQAVIWMQEFGLRYPNCGFGGTFFHWIHNPHPQPYGSFGNGAAMRISPCAYVNNDMKKLRTIINDVTGVTHNHYESYRAANAVVDAIYMAQHGYIKEEIEDHISTFYYKIDFKLDDIRPTYSFDVSCQGSVPQALQSFFESISFEDAIRNAISLGGDSDTIAAITGSIAGAYYGIPDEISNVALAYLDNYQRETLEKFESEYNIKPLHDRKYET